MFTILFDAANVMTEVSDGFCLRDLFDFYFSSQLLQ